MGKMKNLVVAVEDENKTVETVNTIGKEEVQGGAIAENENVTAELTADMDGGEAERVGAPKTEASIRIIPIHKILLDMFKEMRKLNLEGELVFQNRYGKMRSYN